ncbi:MAG: hypothetical protein J6U20_13265 [Fibrobacter sp.]|nr:hypothetical protein [Fibrobacter sp.]
MNYTTEEALKEINRRAGIILKKRERRMLNALATTAGVTLVVLFAVIGEFSGARIPETQSDYGAFILSAETGGYMLTAVLGFVLGVCVTLLVKRLKNK